MHSEAVIERVWRYTWRLESNECGDARGGRERVTSEKHLEAMIEQGWWCTWRLYSSELRDALGGCDRASLEMHLQAMIKRGWRSTRRRSMWRRSLGGRRDGTWDTIHWLTRNCGNVGNWVQHGLLSDERLAGSGTRSILGWCSMWWMQYSVYAVLSVCRTRCVLYSVYAVLGVCCTRCMLYSVYAVLGVNSWSWHE